ncbi:hypothetical protein PTNB73_08824 [Pyrenophora teres f. teres]|nr:hypothetical protein PTNB85_10458 [Pyrenophora teres f. teres]KAE8825165.1 hypothetical protein HRS9122_10264 [Pyrenophora teres f. teres]KAE8857576.1 hypothetical protein PTNB73_08824 [Pyrenophora teres f. teres]
MGALANTYNKPTHGLFRFIPDKAVPYAELMRLDRQAGFWAFYWHSLIGLGYALNMPPFSAHTNLPTIALTAAYMAIWTVVFRGITCTWNDNLDQDFDRQVDRCRNRPIPRGAVSTNQAHVFMCLLIAVGAVVLYPAGCETVVHAGVSMVLLFVYPLLKRWTDFPQVELGFGLSYAVFVVCAVVGKDPLAPLMDASVGLLERGAQIVASPVAWSAVCVYVAGVLWTVVFDTLYAHQDYLDDIKAGVMGLAVLLGRKGTKPVLSVVTLAQIACLVMTGNLAGFGVGYYAITCALTGFISLWLIWATDLEDGASCAWAFGPGSGRVGTSICAGFLVDFMVKKYVV